MPASLCDLCASVVNFREKCRLNTYNPAGLRSHYVWKFTELVVKVPERSKKRFEVLRTGNFACSSGH